MIVHAILVFVGVLRYKRGELDGSPMITVDASSAGPTPTVSYTKDETSTSVEGAMDVEAGFPQTTTTSNNNTAEDIYSIPLA